MTARRTELIALALVAILASAAAAAYVTSRSDGGDRTDLKAGSTAVTPSSAEGEGEHARPCGRLLARAIRVRRICRTATAAVTVAPMERPVLLGEIDVRVYRAELDGTLLTLRVRTRNNFEKRDLVVVPSQKQFYVSANGTKVYGSFLRAVIEASTTEVMDLRFRLDRAQVKRIKARHNVADLTVVPLTQVEERTPDRLGLVRLRVSSV